MGRRAGERNAMSDTVRRKLHVQIQDHRTRGDSVVARALVLATRHRPRRPPHRPQVRPTVALPETLQADSDLARRVVERQRR